VPTLSLPPRTKTAGEPLLEQLADSLLA